MNPIKGIERHFFYDPINLDDFLNPIKGIESNRGASCIHI